MTKKSEIEQIADELPTPEQAVQEASESQVSEEHLNDLDKEIALQEKYGDQTLKAAALGAARGLTFGLSDVALKKSKILSEEALREIDERNQAASLTGEIGGVVVPSLLTGGTTAAAKGAQAATTGVRAATKAGQLAEKATANALKNVLKKDTVAQQIVKNSIPKAAGSAVEGAFYGAGELISEDALGRAEFNAENLAATAGPAALIGGTAGGIFGTAQAIVPVVKKGKIVDYASKKIDAKTDTNMAAAKLSGWTPTKISKIKNKNSLMYNNLANFYNKRLDLKVLDSSQKLANKAQESINTIGKEIDDVLTDIDKIASPTILPTKAEIGQKVQKTLSELKDEFADLPSQSAKKKLRKINQEIASWDSWAKNPAQMSAKETRKLKSKLQNLAKWERDISKVSLEEQMARKASQAVRNSLFDLADRVSTTDANLAQKLRQANLDYSTAIEISESLAAKTDKIAAKDFASLKDILFADVVTELGQSGLAGLTILGKKYLESDLRRRLQILKSVEKTNRKTESKISSGIKTFFEKPKKAARPTSMKVLIESTYATPEEKKPKPKTRLDAFDNIKSNLEKYSSDPNILIDRLSKNGIRMEKVAPKTTQQLQQTVFRGVTFLQQKLPKDGSLGVKIPGLSRPSQPSSLELSKFERYVEGVENPLSIVDDLESGTLTREKVEAVRYVYPDLYVRIQTQVMDSLANSKTEVPYQKRLQLGILLDIPTDESLQPQNILGLQQTFQIEPDSPEAQEASVKPTVTGLGKLKISDDLKTPMQKAVSKE